MFSGVTDASIFDGRREHVRLVLLVVSFLDDDEISSPRSSRKTPASTCSEKCFKGKKKKTERTLSFSASSFLWKGCMPTALSSQVGEEFGLDVFFLTGGPFYFALEREFTVRFCLCLFDRCADTSSWYSTVLYLNARKSRRGEGMVEPSSRKEYENEQLFCCDTKVAQKEGGRIKKTPL